MSRTVRVRDRMRPGAVAVASGDRAGTTLAWMWDTGREAVPVVDDRGVIGLLERRAARASRPGADRPGPVPVASLMRCGAFVCRADELLERAHATMDRLEVDWLAVLDAADRVVGVLGRDRDDDPMRRLVPAFYSAY
jgi:CBS domain-containing protein